MKKLGFGLMRLPLNNYDDKGSIDIEQVKKKVDAFGFIKKMKEEGRIKHLGFSFHDSAKVLEEILSKHPEIEYVQLQINYLDWDNDNVQGRECYELCVKYKKPVIVMEPIKGGSLAQVPEAADKLLKEMDKNASTASWAVRYAASLDNVIMVLSGMSNMEQLLDNVGYMRDFKPLKADEYKAIEEVTDIIKNTIAIPCTRCNYCMEGCPMNIAIPDLFGIYNGLKKFPATKQAQAERYKRNIEKHGRASECIGCKQCEEHCPQHIEITKWLGEIADTFE